MSKGYYYSKSKLSDSLNSEIELDEKIGRIMGTTVLPKREPRSIDEIISNKEKLKELIRKDLGKIMLADDLDRAISYLQSRDELGLFYKTYDAFMKKMGNPTRLGFTNFEINWGKFDKEENVKELKQVDELEAEMMRIRKELEKAEELDIYPTKLQAVEEEYDKLRRELDLGLSIDRALFMRKMRKLREEVERLEKKKEVEEYYAEWSKANIMYYQIQDFNKIMSEFKDTMPSVWARFKLMSDDAKEEVRELNKLLKQPKPNETEVEEQLKEADATVQELKEAVEEFTSTEYESTLAPTEAGIDVDEIKKVIESLEGNLSRGGNKGFETFQDMKKTLKFGQPLDIQKEIDNISSKKELLSKARSLIELSGRGIKKNNKKRRMKIIEGSIEAGNNNPKLSERLWLLKYRK